MQGTSYQCSTDNMYVFDQGNEILEHIYAKSQFSFNFAKNCYSLIARLNETYQASDGRVLTEAVFTKYAQACNAAGEKPLGKQVFGRHVKVALNVVSEWKRDSGGSSGWGKKRSFYVGITERNAGSAISLCDISSTDLPDDVFITKKSSESIRFGFQHAVTFNGNKVLIEAVLTADGAVKVEYASKVLDLSKLGLRNRITMTSGNMQALLQSLKCIRLCHGICAEQVSTPNCTKEVLGESGKLQNIARSLKCEKVVELKSYLGVCRHCRALDRKGRPGDEVNEAAATVNPAPVTPVVPDAVSSAAAASTSDGQQEVVATSPVSGEAVAVSAESTKDISIDPYEESFLCDVLNTIAPELSSNQKLLIESQLKNSKGSPYARRWSEEMITMCLTLWARSPQAYADLKKSGFLVLPSSRLLSMYKNAIQQSAGINPDIFKWMRKTAEEKLKNKSDWYGGLVLDEMAIQEDLQISKRGGENRLVGLVDYGPEGQYLEECKHGKAQVKLANHVLQFVFHGIGGFRFPIAHYPTCQANPEEIYITFWDCVRQLKRWGFTVIYSSIDGSSNNRAFVKLHFEDSPLNQDLTACNLFVPSGQVTFLMDPPHLFKKIRNNILKSGPEKHHTRLMLHKNRPIVWKQWIDAYEWDRATNPFPLHHKLTEEHLYPNSAQKMRNKLAEDVLGEEMYQLMLAYQRTLQNPDPFDVVLEFLGHTKVILSIFLDMRPIKELGDKRICQLREASKWFQEWENEVCQQEGITKSEKQKMLMSAETREDLQFLISGFAKLVKYCLEVLDVSLVPGRVNSDIIENIFCQQRALYNGANTNPNLSTYNYSMNSIILGQASISDKANAKESGAKSFAILSRKPLQTLQPTA